MAIITEALFVEILDSIKNQMAYDIGRADAFSEALGVQDNVIPVYDNSLLIKALIKSLQVWFPKDESNFCDIEHYCFDMNFGKIGEQQLITAEDLWDRLNANILQKETGIKRWKVMDRLNYISDYIPEMNKPDEPIVSTHPLIDDETGQFKTFKEKRP